MKQAIIWSRYHCPYCDRARALLNLHNIVIEERKIGDGWTREELLAEIPDARSVPQIFIDGQYIGGFNELEKFLTEQTRTTC